MTRDYWDDLECPGMTGMTRDDWAEMTRND